MQKDISKIKGDRNKIEQVLVNLLLNAALAVEKRGSIDITTSEQKLSNNLNEVPDLHRGHFKPGDTVIRVLLEDNGSGIPEDKIDKIFDPFVTTRRANGGVGLGLSVSRNIMDIHEGSISLENKEGGGARVTLLFKTLS